MIFNDRFQNSQRIRQPSLTATSTRMLRCPQQAATGTYLGEERQRVAWFFGSGFFVVNSQRYVIYIYNCLLSQYTKKKQDLQNNQDIWVKTWFW
jgi:hypothetical protein